MSKAPMAMSFLRPLGLPRPSTLRHFLQLSRPATTQAASSRQDPNLLASQIAPQTYPPESVRSLPRPKVSHASHRTSQPFKPRDYESRFTVRPKSLQALEPSTPPAPLTDAEVAPQLPYFVTRTKSNELPVYHLRKRGGNLKQTRVKKIDGDVDALRLALQTRLRVSEKECVINRVTGHVVIKGWHKNAVEEFLEARKF